MPQDQRPPPTQPLTLLTRGEVEVEGRMPWSSNATFLVTVRHGGEQRAAIYKPHRGERPLWDFPDGLYRREVAAYEVSEALGWGIVPPTVLREDGPLGPGSLQLFVEADFDQHYFTLLDDEAWHDQLRRIGVFDLVVNNADRKSGHCLLAGNRIWAIDHGLCFHAQPKLRTVIWDFCGTAVPAGLRDDLRALADDPPAGLGRLLGDRELESLVQRARRVSQLGVFPDPDPDSRPYPWPLV